MAERHYVLGDVIVFRVELAHLQNLEEIRVTYGKDGGLDNTITFISEVDSTEEVGSGETMDSGPLRAAPRYYTRNRSTATLKLLVDEDHAPGRYDLISIAGRTMGGFRVNEGIADPGPTIEGASFHVVQEPATHLEARVKLNDED